MQGVETILKKYNSYWRKTAAYNFIKRGKPISFYFKLWMFDSVFVLLSSPIFQGTFKIGCLNKL